MPPSKKSGSSKTEASKHGQLTFERVPSSSDEPTAQPEAGADETPIENTAETTTETTTNDTPTSTPVSTQNTMPASIPKELEAVHAAFKLCAPKRPSPPSPSDVEATQGATFYAISPDAVPRTEIDFKGQDYSFLRLYMVQPIGPGRATAPYEYSRGSKKSKDQLIAFNKTGQPLTQWSNSTHSDIRFWGWEKKGFNRGNRVENQTWTYGGGKLRYLLANRMCHKSLPGSV